MTYKTELDGQSRREFIKTSAAVGAGVTTGVAAFGGQAAAQALNVDADQLNANANTGRLSGLIVLNNVTADVIDDVTLENVTVEILSDSLNNIDIDVQKLVQTNGGDVVRLVINDVLENVEVLNDANVSVQVSVLSDGGDVLQTATDALNV